MNQVTCSHCGAANRSTAKFCARCGQPVFLGAASGPLRLQIGVFVGEKRYRITGVIGEGGFGAVYLAQDERLQRACVVKQMLLPELPTPAQHPNVQAWQRAQAQWQQTVAELRRDFQREAAALSAINEPGHPNIPEIFDFFDDASGHYLVMKYIPGESLEQQMEKSGKPLDWRRAVEILLPVASALSYMHGHRDPSTRQSAPVLHRDVKPANILLGSDERVWLVDFGLSKAQTALAAGSIAGKTTAAGTPGYAPLEQWLLKAVPASDVYALGATLHHILTGRDPRAAIHGDFDLSEAKRIHGRFPPLRQLDPALPAELEAIVAVMLSEESGDRPTSKQALAQLEALVKPTNAPSFYWQDGAIAQQPRDLPGVANRKWAEACGYFTGGKWQKWFEDLHRNDLLGHVQQARSLHKQDDGMALDAFLRMLDPGFPNPHLQLAVAQLDAGVTPWDASRTITVDAQNTGAGCLHSKVVNSTPWLQVKPNEFTIHDKQTIQIVVDTRTLKPQSAAHTGALVFDAGAAGQVQLPIKVTVSEPQVAIDGATMLFGSVRKGETPTKSCTVRNVGGSRFSAVVDSDIAWLTFSPNTISCKTGESATISVVVNSARLRYGANQARVRVEAEAGGWRHGYEVAVVVHLSWVRTFLAHVQQPHVMRRIVTALFLLVLVGGLVFWASEPRFSWKNLYGALDGAAATFATRALPTPSPQPAPPVEPVEAVTALADAPPLPVIPACGGVVAPQLTIGDRAMVLPAKVNMRSSPIVPAQWDANVILVLERGAIVTIVDGPVCAQGGYWWTVDLDDGNQGWVREALPDAVLLASSP